MMIGANTFGLGGVLAGGDFGGQLDRIKQAGADSLEVCLVCGDIPKFLNLYPDGTEWGMFPIGKAPEVIEQIRHHGLEVAGAHSMMIPGRKSTRDDVEQLIELAHQYGLRYYVLSLAKSETAELAEYVPGLNYAVERFAAEGIDFLYHNHEVELKPDRTGETALDYLMREVPGMKLELDVGWVVYSGLDAVETMRKYSDRIRIIHFKDLAPGAGEDRENLHFTAIGEGVLPLKEIVDAAAELDLYEQGLVVDQDNSETDMLADLEASVENIRAGETVTVNRAIEKNPLQLSVWSFPARCGETPQSFKALLTAARRCGVDYIDLTVAEIEAYGMEAVEQALALTGMKVNCYITLMEMDKCRPEQIRKQARRDLCDAARLGADKLMILAGGVDCGNDPRERREAADTIAAVLKIAVEEAQGAGITVCVEDTPSCRVPLSTAAECGYVLSQVPGLKLVFDTANMIPGGDKDPMAFYEELKGDICHVHLKDIRYVEEEHADPCADGRRITCVRIGEGIIPVRKLMERMIADGYTGSAMLEYIAPEEHSCMGHTQNLKAYLSALFD